MLDRMLKSSYKCQNLAGDRVGLCGSKFYRCAGLSYSYFKSENLNFLFNNMSPFAPPAPPTQRSESCVTVGLELTQCRSRHSAKTEISRHKQIREHRESCLQT